MRISYISNLTLFVFIALIMYGECKHLSFSLHNFLNTSVPVSDV
jgi:hypothetical protein